MALPVCGGLGVLRSPRGAAPEDRARRQHDTVFHAPLKFVPRGRFEGPWCGAAAATAGCAGCPLPCWAQPVAPVCAQLAGVWSPAAV